ncbi:MAG: hypothetical protein ABJA62_07055 [Luteimonas sp.]
MDTSNLKLSVLGVVLALGSAVTPQQAGAVVTSRVGGGNAANFCQSSLPVFDVQIRKRPLAVQNEGTTSAFVTCAFNSFSQTQYVAVFFNSTTGSPTTLTCTGISGTNDGAAKYVLKDIPLAGNGTQNKVLWSAADFGGEFTGGGEFGILCNLPPKMGINNVAIGYDEAT